MSENCDDTLSYIPSQTSDFCNSQDVNNVPVPWGRLISCKHSLDNMDLIADTISLGRSINCDVLLTSNNFGARKITQVSNVHFIINRMDDYPPCITDLSRNGTFVNKKKVGKNNKIYLGDDDVIGICNPSYGLFKFKLLNNDQINFLPNSLKLNYILHKTLGNGASADVHSVFCKKTGKLFAIKRIFIASSDCQGGLNDPRRIATEIEILHQISHHHIITMKELTKLENIIFLVLEYMPGGELTHLIRSGALTLECDIKRIFAQIYSAVQYLHSEGITHRDLKPENILLSSHDPKNLIVKISDFGLSKIMSEDGYMQTICGTPYYTAPEILDDRYSQYSRQVDVWSLGVILFYMLIQRLPFMADHLPTLKVLIKTGAICWNEEKWLNVSLDARHLVKLMLTINPEKRIPTEDICLHPWLKGTASKCCDYKEERDMITNSESLNNFAINDKRPIFLSY